MNCFDSLGLTQWVLEPTFPTSGNVLDLVLTTDSERIGYVRVLAPLPSCTDDPLMVGHCPVVFSYVSQTLPAREDVSSRILWHKGAFNEISAGLAALDWDFEFMDSLVQENYDLLCRIVGDLVERYVPVRRGKPAPWQTRPPGWLLRQRTEAWDQVKRTRSLHGRRHHFTVEVTRQFNRINHQYRNCHLLSQAEYEAGLIQQIKTAPKLFHAYIRNKKVDPPSVGPLLTDACDLIENPKEMIELLASAFSDVFVADVPQSPAPTAVLQSGMPEITISVDSVKSVLMSLDSNSSMGPDGIHPVLLKTCCEQLKYPLFIIFSKSLAEGVLPVQWSHSHVVPIYKAKSRYIHLNYRPVSLTSVCCKSLERIIARQLMTFLEENGILSDNQFGFRHGRSTEDQLFLTYCDVVKWFDAGSVVDVVLLDYSKAFDVICHIILLQMLENIGLTPSLVQWIKAFLTGCTMTVCCGGEASDPRSVTSGVPQGSVLGPILFLIYVNAITEGISSGFKASADDYKIYLHYPRDRVLSITDNVARLQADLNRIHSVGESWNLKLNIDKCVVMRFHRGGFDWTPLGPLALYHLKGVPLRIVESHKDLGIWVES